VEPWTDALQLRWLPSGGRTVGTAPAAMPPFAFGWTRVRRPRDGGGDGPVLCLARAPAGEWLAAVTAGAVHVWSAGQHRVVLAEYRRAEGSLAEDGPNTQAGR
jgi:hypothetical protein